MAGCTRQQVSILRAVTCAAICRPAGMRVLCALNPSLSPWHPAKPRWPCHPPSLPSGPSVCSNIPQETTGGWPTAPDGPFSWGLCFREGGGAGAAPEDDYCTPSDRWPCAPGKHYHGRGPLPLRGNQM